MPESRQARLTEVLIFPVPPRKRTLMVWFLRW
jgi:hypothetical protein